MCLSTPKAQAAPVAATPVQEAVAPTPTAVETTDLGKSTAQEDAIKKESKKRGFSSTIKSTDTPTLAAATTATNAKTLLG